MGDEDPAIESTLLDLTRIDDLTDLAANPDSPLALALNRVRWAAVNPEEATFSFQQSI